MIEIEVTKDNLENFLSDIRNEDKEELIVSYGKNYKKKFINTCLLNKETTYFLADNKNNPLAIGGSVKIKKGCLIIWFLVTKKFNDNKKNVLKFVKEKITLFKKENNALFNYIYKSNFKFLKWLKLQGFCVKKLENDNYRLFYYLKGENFDIRYITC